MTPRERIQAVLAHQPSDVLPMLEPWIEAEIVSAFDLPDAPTACVTLGLDGFQIPTCAPKGSASWNDGIDEWGRRWSRGVYVDGVVRSRADIPTFCPPLACAARFFQAASVGELRRRYPNHCLFYGSHIGPFTIAAMSMGYERFLVACVEDQPLVTELLEAQTAWCLAMFREAQALGAELLILGDDAADNQGPMISPALWRQLVLPFHKRIVREAYVPVIWHSDGNTEPLLRMAVEVGFAGVHGLDPGAGVDLARVKKNFGAQLALFGNVPVQVLFGDDPTALRGEVRRAVGQGTSGPGYAFATCNSVHGGMNPALVREMYRLAREAER